MNLRDEIEYLQPYFENAPSSEAETREGVIRPLLKAVGYAASEVKVESVDENNKRPDYTLLPGEGSHTWFLEAKAWRVELKDEQVNQALNYANHNGKRWVVLSNGQSWRLYDNTVLGVSADKLVADVCLRHSQAIERLLEALSPASVKAGGLETYAKCEHDRRADEAILRRVIAGFRNVISGPDCDLGHGLAAAFAEDVPGTERRHLADALRHLEGSACSASTVAIVTRPSPGEASHMGGQATSTSKEWTEYQARVRSLIEKALRETDGIVIDRSFKRGFLFLPKSWDALLPPTSFREWSPNGRTLLFSIEVDRESRGIHLLLYIGPGPEDRRKRLFQIAKDSSLMAPARQFVSQKWHRVLDHFFAAEVYGADSVDAVSVAFKIDWARFVGVELPAIEQEIIGELSGPL